MRFTANTGSDYVISWLRQIERRTGKYEQTFGIRILNSIKNLNFTLQTKKQAELEIKEKTLCAGYIVKQQTIAHSHYLPS